MSPNTHTHTHSHTRTHAHTHTDAAVIGGTLTWRSATDEFGRAAVLFTLTLTLLTSYYPHINATSVGVVNISLPGSFELGTDNDYLRVVAFCDNYFIATGEILHHYHDYADSFSLAEYEFCCRGESLLNNQGTMYVSYHICLTLHTPFTPSHLIHPQMLLFVFSHFIFTG